ncbi:hypothetical protein [Clostridium kluyveri]|uniref:Uncharacterized protein n=1 Tax=Clostridium kluyveri TaxID=1534 RepID=A0A1L5F313_CLOKL|nr:hypothetical protein [Clostridium kluyveri]APM37377.1 hypothetical protein BS101_00645 [Clostridium kluyveri]
MEYMIEEVTGYCPYLDDENTITAKYKKVAMLDGNAPRYIYIGPLSCIHSQKCTCRNKCPLKDKFPRAI